MPSIYPLIAQHLLSLPCPHPLRVGIDGVDASGKTTLADQLAPYLAAGGRQVLRASIDGFHRPRAQRYRQGPDSPAGYYEDSFDYSAVRLLLLDPLGCAPLPIAERRVDVYTKIFDYIDDTSRSVAPINAGQAAILLFDGVFLQRPELSGCFDCLIYVQVSFDTVLARAMLRDAGLMGGSEAVRQRYLSRYIPAQVRYQAECLPEQHADIIIHNDDPHNAEVFFRQS